MDDEDEKQGVIGWQGWRATVPFLRAYGWEFSFKEKYRNPNDSKNTSASSDYIYLRHPLLKMVGRCKYVEGNTYHPLEFLCHEKNRKIKPPRYIEEQAYSEDDIAPMLEAIIAIQSKRPKRKKILPKADILEFEGIANERSSA